MYFKPRRKIYDPSAIGMEKNKKIPNDNTWSKTGGARKGKKGIKTSSRHDYNLISGWKINAGQFNLVVIKHF